MPPRALAHTLSDMEPILFVGGGNMARAIIDGAASAAILDPNAIGVVEPDPQRRSAFTQGFASMRAGVEMLREIEDSHACGRILLAVKPQKLDEISKDLGPLIDKESRCVISILAGTSIARLGEALGSHHRYIRTMPNTPAQIGRGMSAIAGNADAEDLTFARALFSSLGETIEIDESLMDAFTAVAGSGPAYAFLLAEAMSRAANEMGFGEEQSRLIASETLAGAGLLLARGERDPEALRIAVTSPGGTTAAALNVMTNADLPGIVVRALKAARDRGKELGEMPPASA